MSINSRQRSDWIEDSMSRDEHGRFLCGSNKWIIEGDVAYCYRGDEMLFYTDKEMCKKFEGKPCSKIANGYNAVRVGDKEVLVHRYIVNAPEGKVVDHKNRNKKDNRISNLRITGKSENAFNSKLRSTNKSGRCGVWFRKDTGKWSAEIKVNYQKIALGCFERKEEAVRVREEAEVKYYGYKLKA